MRGIFCRRSCLQGTQGERKGEAAAQPVLEELRKVLDDEELQAALERGKALDLEQVVKEILAND